MGVKKIMTSFAEVFDCVKKYFLENNLIGETAFKTWINILEPVELDENVAVFTVESPFQKDIITNRYLGLLKEGFLVILGFEVDIQVGIKENIIKEVEEKKLQLEKTFENAEYDYTFDTFIVGPSNQFAYAACTAITGDKGTKYNPLFIHGPSGLGKTHLLTAISHEIKKNFPGYKIIYVTGETFANELINAIQKKDTAPFHDKYRKADVLLVDDVQFIAGKESTQEEFFHTFNELHKVGKQIVLTSDRPPKDIKTLEDRIRTRFESGLIADVTTPDIETRIAIVRRKAELLDLNISDEVSNFIASSLKTNIRQLEGAVKKLKALNHLSGSLPTMAMAQSVIRDIITDNQPVPVTVEKIINMVADAFGVSSDDIRSNKRSSQISTARKFAMYIIREETGMAHSAIGEKFGGRDHSTVVYAVKDVEKCIEKDSHSKEFIEDIKKNLKN